MWCVNPMLPHALEVIDAWGFKFKTVAFTWAKRSTTGRAWHTGLGYWTRQNTEQCLLATRGKPKRIARNVPQLVVAPLREHSRKPDDLHPYAHRNITGPYPERFALHPHPGRTAAGNQT